MRSEDIDKVMEIEKESFSAPWSARAYEYELHYNDMARYYVARPQNGYANPPEARLGDTAEPASSGRLGPAASRSVWQRFFSREKEARSAEQREPAPVVGYGGFWLMVDEAHISTIASHPQWRGRGIGELLLMTMVDGAVEMGARFVTLEVRVSNAVAQALYRKYDFEQVGIRRGYYSDNREDALIMTTPRITTDKFRLRFQELKASLFERLSH